MCSSRWCAAGPAGLRPVAPSPGVSRSPGHRLGPPWGWEDPCCSVCTGRKCVSAAAPPVPLALVPVALLPFTVGTAQGTPGQLLGQQRRTRPASPSLQPCTRASPTAALPSFPTRHAGAAPPAPPWRPAEEECFCSAHGLEVELSPSWLRASRLCPDTALGDPGDQGLVPAPLVPVVMSRKALVSGSSLRSQRRLKDPRKPEFILHTGRV